MKLDHLFVETEAAAEVTMSEAAWKRGCMSLSVPAFPFEKFDRML
jgi:hypothetical protein